MAKAIAAQTRVAYVAETVAGTTPATPAFKIFRATGEGLDVERRLNFSSELNGKRGQKNHAIASSNGSGDINFEFSDATLEDFLESVLRNTWSTDVLTDANTAKTFTLEVTYEAGATDVFKRFTGAECATLTINAAAGENVTGSVGFMSRGADFATSGIAGATYAAGNTEPVFAGDDVAGLTMAGITPGCVSALTLSINNSLSPNFCLGSTAPSDLNAGKLEVTGSVTMMLDAAQYDVLRAYADGTATSLTFELGSTALKVTVFELPSIVLEGLRVVAESEEGNVVISTNFRALQASSLSGSVIRVTRNQS